MTLTRNSAADSGSAPGPDPAADRDAEIARLRQELAQARQAVARLQAILESATDYAIFTVDTELRVTSWNIGAANLLGWSEAQALGMDSRIIYTPEDRERGIADAEATRALADGRSENERWHLRRDGSRLWGSGLMLPLRGTVEPGFVKILRDRSEQRDAQHRQVLLLRELAHRVKNTLALITSMARQTGSRAESLDSFLELFEGRLLALAAAHELLTQSGWRSISLTTLLHAALAPHGDQIETRVDELLVLPAAAQNLVLVVHELATNAAKHGSLRAVEGRVALETQVTPEEFVLTWRESGGPSVVPPTERGFGTSLLEQIITRQHRGRIDLDWREEGLICTIALPLGEVRDPAHSLSRPAG
jgi:PAS domain S-box-containing protein